MRRNLLIKPGPLFGGHATMKDGNPAPMGGTGSAMQADETYFGRKKGAARKRGGAGHKHAVVSFITDGKSRTFHVARADARTARQILVTKVRRETELHTGESRIYTRVGEEYAAHKTVVHTAGQYVGPDGESTNKVENYFSIFKRGLRGIYQHCAEKHLQRYINEFDFRYSARELTDAERTAIGHKRAEGKRLMYRRTGFRVHVQACTDSEAISCSIA